MLAKQLIDENRLGKIFHYRSVFCRIGRSPQICRKAAKGFGVWMRRCGKRSDR